MMSQSQLDQIANEAAGAVTAALARSDVRSASAALTASIRALIMAEIAAATPGILRAAGVLVKP